MNDPNEANRDLKTPLLDNVIEPEPDVAVFATEPPHQDLEEGTESNPPPTAPHAPNHEDELLQAPILEVIHAEVVDSTITASEGENIHITRDGWKDGFCCCCKHGCFHPSLICAWCFPIVAIAQVMRRFNLLITGKQGNKKESKVTFYVLLGIQIMSFFLYMWSVKVMYVHVTMKTVPNLIWPLISLFIFYLIMRTRYFIRKKYNIPGGCFEDCFASYFFPCCTVSQMARHTTDYDTYRADFYSDTGLPSRVPTLV